jgi:hypothetical protein
LKEGGCIWNDDWDLPADCGTSEEFWGKEQNYRYYLIFSTKKTPVSLLAS